MPFKNKADQAAAAKRHYEANRTKMVERAKAHKEASREKVRVAILEHLRANPCIDCPEDDVIVLEFDHVDRSTKTFAIADAVKGGYSVERVMVEIAKCVVRCANCHRRKTYREGGGKHRG